MASRKHEILRCAQNAFLILGCSAVGFCIFAYSRAALFQAYEHWRFEKRIALRAQRTDGAISLDGYKSLRYSVGEGTSLGRIEAPRLGLSVTLVEGVRPRDLQLAVGHIPGTAFPDELGNVGIAGHRDTFFRELGRIQHDDLIIVRTSTGATEYSVEWTRIVKPSSVDVLKISAQPTLTLVTCYPFYYVGPAPDRFIVRARRVDRVPLQSPNTAVSDSRDRGTVLEE
jgi:sortase A